MKVLKFKHLTAEDWEEVKNWELKNNIDVKNPNRLRREFSDVYPLANIIKESFPKLIDMNNYPRKNGIQSKRQNWETFNFKVLEKLGLTLSRELIESVTDYVYGAIEIVFLEISRAEKKVKLAEERAASERQQDIWKENDDVKIVVVNKQVGDGIVQAPQKMILFSMYEDVNRQLKEKDDLLEAAVKRISYLENIGELRAERISELQAQIGKAATPTSTLATTVNIQDKTSLNSGARSDGNSDLGNEAASSPEVLAADNIISRASGSGNSNDPNNNVITDDGSGLKFNFEKPLQKEGNGNSFNADSLPYTLLPIPKLLETGNAARLSAIIESASTGSVSSSSSSNSNKIHK